MAIHPECEGVGTGHCDRRGTGSGPSTDGGAAFGILLAVGMALAILKFVFENLDYVMCACWTALSLAYAVRHRPHIRPGCWIGLAGTLLSSISYLLVAWHSGAHPVSSKFIPMFIAGMVPGFFALAGWCLSTSLSGERHIVVQAFVPGPSPGGFGSAHQEMMIAVKVYLGLVFYVGMGTLVYSISK